MNRKLVLLAMLLVLSMGLVVFTACGSDDDGVIRMDIQLLGLTNEQMEVYRARGDLYGPGPAFDLAVRRAIEEMENVEVNFVDWGWAETLDTRQRTLIAAGDVPHIVGGEVFMPTYAAEGILLPLPRDIVDSVVPSALLHDNNGVPVAVIGGGGSVFMLFYNRDLLQAAGFSHPPRTWDEWAYQSRRITEVGNGAFWGGGVPSFPHAGGALRATPFFRQLGVDFFQNGQVMLGDPRLHEVLEFIRYMNQFLPPGLGNNADEGPLWDAFEEDQIIAFAVNGTWQVGGAERNNMNWGVAPLPLPDGGQYGNCLVGVTFFGVPRGAPHPEISFDLIRVTLREDVSAQSFLNNRASPVRALHNRRYLFEHSEALTVAMDALAEGGFSGLVAFPRNSSQIWELINTQVLARTTMTNDPIATITADVQRQVDMILGKIGRAHV